MRTLLLVLCLLLCTVLCPACSSIETVDIAAWQQDSGLTLTQSDAPPGAQSMALLSAHRSGLYLFGLIPVVKASFEHCIRQIVRDAKEAGADGVSNLRIDYRPPSLFSLSEPIFPWMAHATITGMAFRRRP